MSISSQRFKFLDKETNISTKDFTELSDNLNYNVKDMLNNAEMLDVNESSADILKGIDGFKSDLDNIALDDSLKVNDLISQAFNDIKNMDLPEMAKNALNSITEIDQSGFMGFLQDSLKIGSKALCNNSEFLKMFLVGYSPHKNVASGLLLAFLLSMLDKYCNQFTQNERNFSPKKDMLYNLTKYTGIDMNSNNALGTFKKYFKDHLKSKQPLSSPPTTFNTPAFLDSVTLANTNLEIKNIVASLEIYEFNSTEKNSLITALDNEALVYIPGSKTYNNILYAKGEVRNLSSIRSDRRTRSIKYENVNDNLGSMMKNIRNVDLNSFQFQGLTGQDLSMFNALSTFQNTSQTNNTASIRSNRSGSFSDVNFSTLLPTLDPQTETNLLNDVIESSSHRLYDLHPTSSIFI